MTVMHLCHSSCVGATGLQWLKTRAVRIPAMHRVVSYTASLLKVLKDVLVNEKSFYNFLNLETNYYTLKQFFSLQMRDNPFITNER